MRTIRFYKEGVHITDPVKIGEVIKIRHGRDSYTTVVCPEDSVDSCEGCVFWEHEVCNVPETGHGDYICADAKAVFKDLNAVVEDI